MQEAEEPMPDPLPESDTDNDKYRDFVRVPGGGMCNITFDEVRTSSCSAVLVLLAHVLHDARVRPHARRHHLGWGMGRVWLGYT